VGVKQVVESHAVVLFMTVAAVAFATGWAAHIAVQSAANLVTVPSEQMKKLDDLETLKSEYDSLRQRAKDTEEKLKGAEEELKGIEAVSPDRVECRGVITALSAENKRLRQQILENRPIGDNYIANITLNPPSPATLKVGDVIEVSFDFATAAGEKVGIWAQPADVGGYTYSGSASDMTGKGSGKRIFRIRRPEFVKEIKVYMLSAEGDQLYSLTVPVSYTFK
jgi:hypothetical protein